MRDPRQQMVRRTRSSLARRQGARPPVLQAAGFPAPAVRPPETGWEIEPDTARAEADRRKAAARETLRTPVRLTRTGPGRGPRRTFPSTSSGRPPGHGASGTPDRFLSAPAK